VIEHADSTAPSPKRRAFTSRLFSQLGRCAAVLTVAAGVPTIGASGAAFAWPLELFCHFRVQYAIALLILGTLLLVVQRFGWATAAFVLFAVNAWHVAPYVVPISGTTDAGDGARLKLVSINVWSGNRTPDRVIEFLRDADPDVIVVLEFTPEWERQLEVLKSTHPYSALQSRAGNFGVALYSRRPLADFEFVPLSDGNHAVAARIKVDKQLTTVIGAHPVPPMGKYWSDLRNRQLDQLAKYVASVKGATIVAGDLNITPFSPYFDEFLAAAKLHDPRRGQGLFTTWPTGRLPLRIPIDHCLVSDGMTARLATGPDVGSDHLPVVAELYFNQTSTPKSGN
jgi:endonuclease/exonuclease/phosphatase (EEP) superfamily protein YafD